MDIASSPHPSLSSPGQYFYAADATPPQPSPPVARQAWAQPHASPASADGRGHGRDGGVPQRSASAVADMVDQMEERYAATPRMTPDMRAELAAIRNQLRITYERTHAVEVELAAETKALANVDRVLGMLHRAVEEELMMNANLAKLAVKSTSGDFDVLASDFMREALGHSRGALPTHAVMRELIDAKFEALADGPTPTKNVPRFAMAYDHAQRLRGATGGVL